jgi:hypothetical protein
MWLVTATEVVHWMVTSAAAFMQDWHFRADHGLLWALTFVKVPNKYVKVMDTLKDGGLQPPISKFLKLKNQKE